MSGLYQGFWRVSGLLRSRNLDELVRQDGVPAHEVYSSILKYPMTSGGQSLDTAAADSRNRADNPRPQDFKALPKARGDIIPRGRCEMQRRALFAALVALTSGLVFSPNANAKEETVTLEISGMT